MKKEIVLKGRTIEYELEYKKVKNVNLRVRDGRVYVSLNKWVKEATVEAFLKSKADWILKALDKVTLPLTEYFTEEGVKSFIKEYCDKCYPYYENLGIKKPQIKFKKMTSKWGSCNYVKGVLTFNINLLYAPKDCVKYVVLHEFTHFLVQDHSKRFYNELNKVCPDWKNLRKKLRDINIQKEGN